MIIGKFNPPKEKNWENWFAWFPVRTLRDELVWLELVERKETDIYDERDYIYRRIDNKPKNINFAI
jgi:hypothetical protein